MGVGSAAGKKHSPPWIKKKSKLKNIENTPNIHTKIKIISKNYCFILNNLGLQK
jgi:hypothetical protein